MAVSPPDLRVRNAVLDGEIVFCDYVQARGEELFAAACDRDLEGIVAKWRHGKYVNDPDHPWVKIKNPAYSQIQGRHEQFDRMRKWAASAGK